MGECCSNIRLVAIYKGADLLWPGVEADPVAVEQVTRLLDGLHKEGLISYPDEWVKDGEPMQHDGLQRWIRLRKR